MLPQIADRLCGAIGQDIIDCLFSRSTLEVISHRKRPTSHTLRPLFYFLLALIYTGKIDPFPVPAHTFLSACKSRIASSWCTR